MVEVGIIRSYVILTGLLILVLANINIGLAYWPSFGVEYDSTNGLGVNRDSATSFANRMAADGWDKKFFWGDSNAFEKDFKDVSKGGWDNSYADNVDMVFWEGHGSPDGLYFPAGTHDDDTASYNDAIWGNLDMEWIFAHSCSVLADSHLSDWAYKACAQGCHVFCSHATTVYACNAGDKLAQYLLSGMTIKDAWFKQHLDLQPSGVTAKVICTPATANDHIWNHGSVGPWPVPGDSWVQYWITK